MSDQQQPGTNIKQTCSVCLFFDEHTEDGVCRRHPPIAIQNKIGWPAVQPTDWCGDFTSAGAQYE